MKHLHFLHPSFVFISLLIISTNIPSCLCEDDGRYTNCSKAFSCTSSIQNIKYPFWGENRDNYCGGPNFGLERLTCEGGVPKISINSFKYRILGWEDTTQMLTVARDDYWSNNDICASNNMTFDQTPFQYDDDGLVYITLFYDCRSNSDPPTIPTNPPTTLLPANTTCADGKSVYYTNVSSPLSYLALCKIVVIPIFGTNAQLVSSNQKTISDALKAGFGLNWTGDYQPCKRCTDSGGECGFYDEQFQCFCKDGPHSTSCTGYRKICSIIK